MSSFISRQICSVAIGYVRKNLYRLIDEDRAAFCKQPGSVIPKLWDSIKSSLPKAAQTSHKVSEYLKMARIILNRLKQDPSFKRICEGMSIDGMKDSIDRSLETIKSHIKLCVNEKNYKKFVKENTNSTPAPTPRAPSPRAATPPAAESPRRNSATRRNSAARRIQRFAKKLHSRKPKAVAAALVEEELVARTNYRPRTRRATPEAIVRNIETMEANTRKEVNTQLSRLGHKTFTSRAIQERLGNVTAAKAGQISSAALNLLSRAKQRLEQRKRAEAEEEEAEETARNFMSLPFQRP